MDSKTLNALRPAWATIMPTSYRKRARVEMNQSFIPHFHVFKGTTVVDIGCNAGLITYDLAEHADRYIGVEMGELEYRQALLTRKYIKTPGEFLHCSVSEFLEKPDVDYDAAFAGRLLYYLTEECLDRMAEVMLPKCKVVMFVSREAKKKSDRMGLIKRGANTRRLHRAANICKWLESSGMSVEVPEHHTSKRGAGPLIAVIGRWSSQDDSEEARGGGRE